ncbi:MAG: MFS transporter, partial [Ilumatobacteraceae bacterium]
WVGAIGLLWMLRGSFRPERPPSRTSLRREIGEGIRFLVDRPLLRSMAIMVGMANLASSATGAVLVLFAVGDESTLGLTSSQFGLLLLVSAAGSIAATFAVEGLVRSLGRSRTLTLAVIGMTFFVGAPAVTTNIWIIAASMLVGGFMVMLWNIPTVSFRQSVTPDHLLGRLNSVYRLLAWGTLPLGAALGGLLAEWLGLRAVFAIMGVVSLGLLVPNLTITDQRLDEAEARADRERARIT